MIVIALAACGTKRRGPPAPRPETIQTVTDLADRACACETDKECIRPIRDEWEAAKDDLVRNGLTGEPKQQFEAQLLRMRMCGDAAGLTFWMPPPPEE